MDDCDLEAMKVDMAEAESEQEQLAVICRYMPKLASCLNSTNKHVKAIEHRQDEHESWFAAFSERISKDIARAFERIEDALRSPRWADGKLDWLKANWQWLMLVLIFLQVFFNVDVKSISERFIK